MSNGSPPARRRPATGSSSGGGATSQRPSVRKAGAARPVPPPVMGTMLVVSAGPHAGEEFTLEDGEYIIGRASDNPICIPDTSVSRKHVLVRRLGGGWAASDLGSGNGTLVNGEPISDEVPLAHGDVLTLGDTEVTFHDSSNATMMMPMPSAPPSRPGRSASRTAVPAADTSEEGGEAAVPRRPPPRPDSRVRSTRSRGAAAAPDPMAQKRKKRLLLLTAAVFVMLVGLLAAIKVKQQQQAEAEAAAAAAIEERRAALGGLFQDAKNLIREGKWSEAKAKLLELQEVEPDYVQLADYLARVEKEIPNQEALDAAKAALDKDQLGVAATALAKVNKDTQLFEQLRTYRAALVDKADKRVREAQALMDQKQLDQAKVITDDVLAALPEHRDGKVISEQVARAIEIRDRPAPPPPPPATIKPWDLAVNLFRDGDQTGAMNTATSCARKHSQCRALVKQMTDFGNLYKRMENLDAKGLIRLLDLDKKITNGRGSKLARNAGTRASNIFFRSASSAKASGQFGVAMANAQRAIQADPNHVGANSIIAELRQKAKDLYLQAYALKDADPQEAIPKFREVMAMTASDDETHQKARSWIEKIQQR